MSLVAQDVVIRAGSATLLEGISITVEPGEIVAVAGPNGAGKSTLIATLAGDRQPEQGSVTLAGRTVSRWPRGELARRRAVMGTDRSMAFAFSAADVALLGRLPLHGGDPSDADRAVVRQLLEDVDCAHLADRVFVTLSTGERQRVALARAIAQLVDATEDGSGWSDGPVKTAGGAPVAGVRAVGAPVAGETAPAVASPAVIARPTERYLLLDEPTSSLDPAHQHLAMRLLRRHARAGLGVLAVLHDLNLAAAYADRIVLMTRARVAASGAPVHVLRPDLLEEVFGIPMLVLPHPHLAHPLVIAEPHVE